MIPEAQSYLDTLRELRANVLKALEGLNGRGLNWTPTREQSNSLFVLATHGVGSEHGWIFETLHQGPETRHRPAEVLEKGEDIAALRHQYDRIALETEDILGALTERDLGTTHDAGRHGKVTTRWIILHVVRHYSEHIGQMYLTRQLYEVGDPKMGVED